MRTKEDYYKILQVHYLAEPEVIESAYKRLAKKYHPDVNKNKESKEIMQRINKAYEVLGNPDKRGVYDMVWEKNYESRRGYDNKNKDIHEKYNITLYKSKTALDKYFKSIAEDKLDTAYGLISNIDKENITKEDFINWQKAVSVVYKLQKYDCEFHQVYKDKLLCGYLYSDVIEFDVAIEEYNEVMDMVEKNVIKKMVVLDEDGEWRVFIGYEKLQGFINKFKSLTSLLNAKDIIQELNETHNRTDSLTGLLNQRGMKERIESEIQRFDRYGNVFSLIMCNIYIGKRIGTSIKEEVRDFIISEMAKTLKGNLRGVDTIGRWEDNSFLILLPETNSVSAIKTANKIKTIFREERIRHRSIIHKVSMSFSITEYASSLEETLNKLNDGHSKN
ncbi:MAG: diguanylate cyclase [Firmicutes bacterium]|nr:diguanylate cyclase [Bacillota bacterium]